MLAAGHTTYKLASLCVVSGLLSAAPVRAQNLRAGAAKIEITPPINEMPAPFTRVGDPIFVRALVLDNGSQRAVLVIADVPTIVAKEAADLTSRIATQTHTPIANVLLGTTHTHNSIRVDTNPVGISLPGSTRFVTRVTAAILQAVQQADANLQSARAGSGAGTAHLIANRNEWYPAQHRYIDGVDRTGIQPINQQLGVLKVEALDGKPIAFVLNYGIEPVVAQPLANEIGGDVPGATARYVEDRLGGSAVALFTIGSAGTPLYRAEAGLPPGSPDPRTLLTAMGTILGEEALATARDIHTTAAVRISGEQHTLTCPGKATVPFNLPTMCAYTPNPKLPACVFQDHDTDPVQLKTALLRIGDLALVEADANVVPALAQKLAQTSPYANTWMVALTFGPLRFVVDDAAYPLNTYEATATTAKQGCAEEGFLKDTLQMLQQ